MGNTKFSNIETTTQQKTMASNAYTELIKPVIILIDRSVTSDYMYPLEATLAPGGIKIVDSANVAPADEKICSISIDKKAGETNAGLAKRIQTIYGLKDRKNYALTVPIQIPFPIGSALGLIMLYSDSANVTIAGSFYTISLSPPPPDLFNPVLGWLRFQATDFTEGNETVTIDIERYTSQVR